MDISVLSTVIGTMALVLAISVLSYFGIRERRASVEKAGATDRSESVEVSRLLDRQVDWQLANVRDFERSRLELADERHEFQQHIGKSIKNLEYRLEELQSELSRRPQITSVGPEIVELDDLAQIIVDRGDWSPASLYISGDDPREIKAALNRLLLVCGLEIAAEKPGIEGSWLQKMWLKVRKGAGSEGVQERLKKVEHALQVQYLGKPQSEVDKNKAEAAAVMLAAVDKQEEALIRLGTLVIMKSPGQVAVWTISELQAAELEQHGHLMNEPEKVLHMLGAQANNGNLFASRIADPDVKPDAIETSSDSPRDD
jgi:hypothetical protein